MISIKAFSILATALALAYAPVGRGVEHQVVVGGPGVLRYDPEFVNAAPGDTIAFMFKQKNHTVTQSTFENPCSPLPNGFSSGFVPVADSLTNGPFPIARLSVKDTNPIWAYCQQGNHCQQGMVFAVNPGDQFAAFKAAATGQSAPPPPPAPPASSPPSPPPAQAAPITVTATVTVSGTQPITTTYASYPGSAAPTSAVASDHKVIVGGPGKLLFTPSSITAQVGDTVTFQFMQKNHTVTQSTFANPCTSLTQTSTSGQVGFDSGFMPVPDTAIRFPNFTIRINDTAPIWAFCKQGNHCTQGMVFAINTVESGPDNFSAFQAKAKSLASPSGSGSPPAPSRGPNSGAVTLLANRGITVVIALVVLGSML